MSKSVSLHTLGCKLNYSETSSLAKQFESRGLTLKNYGDRVDIFVLNTCTVTDNADKECRQIVRSVIRNNPDTYVIVTGCYAQLQPGELASIEGVDLILGSQEKFKLFDYLENIDLESPSCVFKEPEARIYVSGVDDSSFVGEAFSADTDSRTRAFLKIQDGCDYNCSFCTIPLARGGSRSLGIDTVLENAKKIIDAGYREIILTGVNTGDYRYGGGEVLPGSNGTKNNNNVYRLIDVLYKLEKLDVSRIRISSIEPNLLGDDIIGLYKSSEKFCRHFHIPLQSGDPEMLKLMRRRYNRELYSDLVHKLNEEIPGVGIGADVIIGFPVESESSFENTYSFIDSLPVSYLHVFSYSERRNTSAASMQGRVDVKTKKLRSQVLRNLSAKKRFEFYSGHSGSVQEVLFESKVAEKGGKEFIEGFTGNYIRVRTENDPALHNEIRKVMLGQAEGTGPVECILVN